MSDFREVERIVDDTFPINLKHNILDLLLFFKSNSMEIKRLFGYWSNQLYYSVSYQNECVCYILFNGTGDEKQFSPLTIWTDDSKSKWYESCDLTDEEKRIAWGNVDYCVNCGSCKGGTAKTIFDKQFNNVCRTTLRFTNPDKNEFSVLKKITLIRKEDIKNKNIGYCGNHCEYCFFEECNGCKSGNASCSYANLFDDKKCPNALCCANKDIAGCWKCDNVMECKKGFFSSGENDAKAYALYIKKHGEEKYTKRILELVKKGYNYPMEFKDINDVDKILEVFEKE